MALIEVKVDATRPLMFLRNGGKRVAFAIVNTLNATAKAIQKAEVAAVQRDFTVRKPGFILGTDGKAGQAAVIRAAGGGSGFASVSAGRFEARIAVGQKPRLFLSGFETGEERRPFKGKNVAVPITGGPARPTFRSSVPAELTFKGLSLRRVTARGQQKRKRRSQVTLRPSVTRTGKVQWKGAHRTFLLAETAKAPRGGVFQRVGPGRDDIRMVYSFKPPKRLPRRLHFIRTGEEIARRVYAATLQREVNAALAYNILGGRI
jgi:hypothetical protein